MITTGLTFRSPEIETEWQRYYELRWRILRKPWNQPQGSEKDELEDNSFHIAAFEHNQHIVGIGRLHLNSAEQAQIRYMAVQPDLQNQGIGTNLLMALERIAEQQGAREIILNARDSHLSFYLKHNYIIKETGQTLFNLIPHTVLYKKIKPGQSLSV